MSISKITRQWHHRNEDGRCDNLNCLNNPRPEFQENPRAKWLLSYDPGYGQYTKHYEYCSLKCAADDFEMSVSELKREFQ
jgi:hypothetical protein